MIKSKVLKMHLKHNQYYGVKFFLQIVNLKYYMKVMTIRIIICKNNLQMDNIIMLNNKNFNFTSIYYIVKIAKY